MFVLEFPRIAEVISVASVLFGAIALMIKLVRGYHNLVMMVEYMQKDLNSKAKELREIKHTTENRMIDLTNRTCRIEEGMSFIKENIREAIQWQRLAKNR